MINNSWQCVALGGSEIQFDGSPRDGVHGERQRKSKRVKSNPTRYKFLLRNDMWGVSSLWKAVDKCEDDAFQQNARKHP